MNVDGSTDHNKWYCYCHKVDNSGEVALYVFVYKYRSSAPWVFCTFCYTSLIVSAMDSRGYAFCRGCLFNGDPLSMLHLARTEERELFEFCASVTVNSLECHYSHTFHSMMIILPDFQLRERLSLPNLLQTGRTLAVLQGAVSGDQQVMGYDATTAAGAEGRNVG